MLFIVPDGRLMQWTPDMLEGTPFTNYLIQGLILFLFVGVYPMFVVYTLLKKSDWHWLERLNRFKTYHWAWSTSLAAGVIMLIWVITETVLLGYISFLQPVVMVWGIVLIILTLLPAIRQYCRINN